MCVQYGLCVQVFSQARYGETMAMTRCERMRTTCAEVCADFYCTCVCVRVYGCAKLCWFMCRYVSSCVCVCVDMHMCRSVCWCVNSCVCVYVSLHMPPRNGRKRGLPRMEALHLTNPSCVCWGLVANLLQALLASPCRCLWGLWLGSRRTNSQNTPVYSSQTY